MRSDNSQAELVESSDQAAPSVLAANEDFYKAFNQKDLTLMDDLWATSDDISCIHPQAGMSCRVAKPSWRAGTAFCPTPTSRESLSAAPRWSSLVMLQ